MTALKIWDMADLPNGEAREIAVPCAADGHEVTAPRSGVCLYVLNGSRRPCQVIVESGGNEMLGRGPATIAIGKGSKDKPCAMILGPFGAHLEIQPDPLVRFRYEGAGPKVGVFAFADQSAAAARSLRLAHGD